MAVHQSPRCKKCLQKTDSLLFFKSIGLFVRRTGTRFSNSGHFYLLMNNSGLYSLLREYHRIIFPQKGDELDGLYRHRL